MGEHVSNFCEAVKNRQLNRVGVTGNNSKEKKYTFVDRRQRDGSACKDIYEIWILWVKYK